MNRCCHLVLLLGAAAQKPPGRPPTRRLFQKDAVTPRMKFLPDAWIEPKLVPSELSHLYRIIFARPPRPARLAGLPCIRSGMDRRRAGGAALRALRPRREQVRRRARKNIESTCVETRLVLGRRRSQVVLTSQTSRAVTVAREACAGSKRVNSLLVLYEE